jgi:CDP-6-deoxy-D-xylo-4-hexulose-3-dehydrase
MFKPKIDRVEYGGAIIGIAEVKAIMDVVLSQGGKRWTVGPESIAFEKELAEVVGVKRSVVVNSGSSALLIAMTALKLPKGSKVIIPAVNFPTAFNVILQNNLIPLVVDVDINTLNLDLDKVKEALLKEGTSDNVSAVIAVDIAGNPVDLVKLREIVGDDVKIILDDCDGLGGTINGEYKEVFADISCVSFHAAHIITMGEGGAVLTNDEDLANTALKMREWGRASGTDRIYEYPGFPDDYKERYVYEEIGYNVKPLELQCAMGRVQLRRIEEFKTARANNFSKLKAVFDRHQDKFQTMQYIGEPCWFSFPFLCNTVKRGEVMKLLEDNNIECRTIFSGNITLHPAYKDSVYEVSGTLDNADRVMRDGMFLSVHPSVNDDMIAFIDEVLSQL